MKKILSMVLIGASLASCSSSNLLSSASQAQSSIAKISNTASTVNEILTLTNALGLTKLESSVLTNALTAYITNYQKLSQTADAVSALSSLKTSTLSTISSGLGVSKYDALLGILKATAGQKVQSSLSTGAVSVLTSLL